MAQRKKKRDKLIVGFLALVTAFSPVASVVPVYAAGSDDVSSSVTMDPDSVTVEEGSDGIVLENPDSEEGTDGITVMDDGEGSDGITIGENDDTASDGIDVDKPDDGIEIDNSDDGIDIDNTDDGIDVDKSDDGIKIDDISVGDTVDGITIDDITKSEDGIIIESTDEDGNQSITLDPWGGEIAENTASVPTMYELGIDLRSVHGCVKMTPVDADESDPDQIKYIRVSESDGGYNIIVTDDNDNVVYESPYDDLVGVCWSEFIGPDTSYTIEAIADNGYVITDYSIVSPTNKDEITDVNDFKSGIYSSYSWDMTLRHDRTVIVNFGSSDGINVMDTEEALGLSAASDVLNSVEMTDNFIIGSSDENKSGDTDEVTETVILETEKDTLGYENVDIIPSMVDDVEVPEITNADRKEAVCDPVYEGYIKENINSEYVDFQELMPTGSMLVKQTFFDSNHLNGRTTIDQIMFSDEEDKLETLVTQMDTLVPVYDVGDSKYYVAYVDTMHNDSRSYVTDHQFAYNNLNGEVLDDCIYDYDTGIAYVNKDYFFNEDDEFVLDYVQVQLGQVIDYSDQYTESVVLDSTSDDINVDSFDVFTGECTFYVDKGLDPRYINVSVNGGPCLYDYEYDSTNGSLTLQVSAALVSSVYVEDTRSVGQSILNAILPFTVAKAAGIDPDDMDTLGEIVLKDKDVEPKAGDGGKETGTYHYYNNGKKNLQMLGYPYTCYSIITSDPVASKWVDWLQNKTSSHPALNIVNDMSSPYMCFSLDMDTLTSKNLPFKWDNMLSDYDSLRLPMRYSHVGNRETGVKLSYTKLKGIDYATAKKGNVWCRVIKKWKKTPDAKKTYVLLGITTGTMCTQTGVGLVKVFYTDTVTPIELQLQKTINRYLYGNVNLDDLDTYQLEDTLFGIYDSKAHAKNAPVIDSVSKSSKDLDKVGENGLIKKLRVKNDEGYTGTWKLHKEPGENFWRDSDNKKIPSVIYVVELKAGNGYSLPTLGPISDGTLDGNLDLAGDGNANGANNRVIAFDLDDYYSHLDDNKVLTFKYANQPLFDPGALTLFKTDNPDPDVTEIEEYKEKYSNPEMNGAKFKLEYWGLDYKKFDDDIEVAVDKIANGFNVDLGKPDDGTPGMGDDHVDVPAHKPDAEVILQTIHDDFYGDGFLSLTDERCIVESKWPYYYATAEYAGARMPIGVYRFTEIEAPPGYRLPSQTEFLASCEQVNGLGRVGLGDEFSGERVFDAEFQWADMATDTITISQMLYNASPSGINGFNYDFHPYLFDEEPKYVNVGLFKIDKDTGKPGKPLNDVLSLEGIEFEIVYSPDNDESIKHPFLTEKDGKTPLEIKRGDTIKGVKLVTDENGCADTVGINIKDGVDFGVLVPGHKYILKESKSNDSFILNKKEFPFEIPRDIPSDWRPDDGTPACLFPTKDGSVIAHKDIKSAKNGYEDYLKPESERKLDYNSILMVENESPNIGVGVQKFDIMLDSSVRDMNGIANQGNATLEGHTFVVINGTKSEVRLNDKKTLDGKGTKIKSIWEHGDHLKNPYNPTYEELYHYAEESDFQVDPDGDGYICAVLKTDKDGYAETAKDLLPLGVYWIIEVDTKITDEGYHDYLVNKLDVGHVGEYEPGGDGVDEDGNSKDSYVLKKDGEKASASNMDPDGEVFAAEFTQNLKDTEWKSIDKIHSDKKEAANKPPRGGVQFQKYNWNSDDPYATGDSDLSGAKFAIINVSDAVVQNKDGDDIPTWKGHGYNGKSDFAGLKYSAVKAALGKYKVQEVVTELVEDSRSDTGYVNIDQVCQFLKEKLLV